MTTPMTDAEKLAALSSGLGTGSSAIGKVDISTTQYNVQGLGLSAKVTGGKPTLSADEFMKALQRTAIEDPQTWAGIQYAMYRSNYYGQTLPDLGSWGSSDPASVKRFMEALTLTNTDPAAPAPVSTFLTEQENAAISLGGNGVRSQIANVTVPNSLDLGYIADKAFRTALGRPPTPAESKKFTASYQSDVMAVARANAATVAGTAAIPKTPTAPITTATPGMATSRAGYLAQQKAAQMPSGNTIAQNLSEAQTAPTTQIVAKQDVANADVAAAEFARTSDPRAAAVHGLNDAMTSWFSSLAKGNQ